MIKSARITCGGRWAKVLMRYGSDFAAWSKRGEPTGTMTTSSFSGTGDRDARVASSLVVVSQQRGAPQARSFNDSLLFPCSACYSGKFSRFRVDFLADFESPPPPFTGIYRADRVDTRSSSESQSFQSFKGQRRATCLKSLSVESITRSCRRQSCARRASIVPICTLARRQRFLKSAAWI